MEKIKAYLDSNVFLYAVVSKSQMGALSRKLLSDVQSGDTEACTSTLTFDELFWNTRKLRGREKAVKACKTFLEFPNLKLIDVTKEVLFIAQKMLERYDLGPRDAIHVACAVKNNISVFVSEDKDIDKIKEVNRKSIRQSVFI